MSIYDPTTGFTGTPDPARLAWGPAVIADARLAADGATLDLFPSADHVFIDPFGGEPQLASTLEDIATVTRASKAWISDWSRVNGDRVGSLIAVENDKPAWGPNGLVISPSIENLVTNPRAQGAAAPSTMPTDWSGATAAGVTLTVIGAGEVDGWPYLEIERHGTATAGFVMNIGPQATVAAGDNVTISAGLALISGEISAPTFLRMLGSAGVVGTDLSTTPQRDNRRWAKSGVMPATSTWARPQLLWGSGTVFTNARMRIFAPMLTKTDYAAPIVLPPVGTPGAAVRAADALSISPTGWYRHDEGTLVVEFDTPPIDGRSVVSLAVNTHYGRTIRALSGTIRFDAAIQAGGTASLIGPAITAGRHIAAMTWDGRDHGAAFDGVALAPWSTTADVLTPDALRPGQGGTLSAAPSGGHTHRVRFFPYRMTDAEMAERTTPYWSG